MMKTGGLIAGGIVAFLLVFAIIFAIGVLAWHIILVTLIGLDLSWLQCAGIALAVGAVGSAFSRA